MPLLYEEIERHDYENAIMWHGRNHRGPFTVIMTGQLELDNKRWLHISVARPDRLPEWNLLKEIKTIFIGKNRQAIQIIPSEAKYVNFHPYCLHLFCCVEEQDPIPDFTHGGTML